MPDEKDRLAQIARPAVVVDGAQKVTVVPRAREDRPGGPFICHLINRNYDLEGDSVTVQRDFRVRLSQTLFGSAIARARLHAPGSEPVELAVTSVAGGSVVTVPELALWAVVELMAD